MATVYNRDGAIDAKRAIMSLLEREKTLLRLTAATMRHFELLQCLRMKQQVYQEEVDRLSAIVIVFDTTPGRVNIVLEDVVSPTFEERDREMKELVRCWRDFGNQLEDMSTTSTEYSYYDSSEDSESEVSEDFEREEFEDDKAFRKEAGRLSYIHLIPVQHTARQTFYESEAAVFRNMLLKEDKYLLFREECQRLGSIAVEASFDRNKAVLKERRRLQVLLPITASAEDIKNRVEASKEYCLLCEEESCCFSCASKELRAVLLNDKVLTSEIAKNISQRVIKEERRWSLVSPIFTPDSVIKARADMADLKGKAEGRVKLNGLENRLRRYISSADTEDDLCLVETEVEGGSWFGATREMLEFVFTALAGQLVLLATR